jgi:hypothetical protein
LTDLCAVHERPVATVEVANERALRADIDTAVVPGQRFCEKPLAQSEVTVPVTANDAGSGRREPVFGPDVQPANDTESECADHVNLLLFVGKSLRRSPEPRRVELKRAVIPARAVIGQCSNHSKARPVPVIHVDGSRNLRRHLPMDVSGEFDAGDSPWKLPTKVDTTGHLKCVTPAWRLG